MGSPQYNLKEEHWFQLLTYNEFLSFYCHFDAVALVINNIMTRVSIRQFTGEPITQEQIDILLKAGMAAPSAVNKQPWVLFLVGIYQRLLSTARTFG